MHHKNTDKQIYTELTDELMFKLGYFKLNLGREESHGEGQTITTDNRFKKMLSVLWKRNSCREDGRIYYNLITPDEILNYINDEN